MRKNLHDVRVIDARSPWQRAVGLIGRTHVADDEAMLFRKCSSIHTLFMRVPIDVLFLDGSERVVRAVAAVPPWRPFIGCTKASSVVELAAGAIKRLGIASGDVLGFVKSS